MLVLLDKPTKNPFEGVVKDERMCRIGPDNYEAALGKPGCREMIFTAKPMRGYVFVADEAMRLKTAFDYWINACLAFNGLTESSKKKKIMVTSKTRKAK